MSPPGASHVDGTAVPQDASVWNLSKARLVLASVSPPSCRGSSGGDDIEGGCAERSNLAEHLGFERCLDANESSITIAPYRSLDAKEMNGQNYFSLTKEVIPGAGYPQELLVQAAWNGTAECKEKATLCLKPGSETQDSNLGRLHSNASVMPLKGVPSNVQTNCSMCVNNVKEDAPAVGHLQVLETEPESNGFQDKGATTGLGQENVKASGDLPVLSASSLDSTDLTNLGNWQCEFFRDKSRWIIQAPDQDIRRRLSQHFEATLWLSKLAYDMMRAACRATAMQSGASADSWSKIHSEDDIICNEELDLSRSNVLLLLLSWWKPTHKVTDSRSTLFHIEGELKEFYALLRDVKMQGTYFGDINTVELVHLVKQLRVYEAAKGTDVHLRVIAAWQLMREQFESGCVFTTIKREDVDIGILRGNPDETTSVHCFQLGCEPPTDSEMLAYEDYRKCHRGDMQTLKPTLVSAAMQSYSVQPNGYVMQGFRSRWREYCVCDDDEFLMIYNDNAAEMIAFLAADIRRAALRATLILHGVPPKTWLNVFSERSCPFVIKEKELNRYLPEARRLLLSWWAPGTNNDASTECDFGDGLEDLHYFCGDISPDVYFPNLSSSTLLCLAKRLKARNIVDSLRRFYKLFAAWQLMRERVENGSEFQAISRADKVVGILYGMHCMPRSHLEFCEFNGDDRLVPTPSEIAKYERYKAVHFKLAHELLATKTGKRSWVTLDCNFTEDDKDIQKIRGDHLRRLHLHAKAKDILADLSRDLERAACRVTLMLHGAKPEEWSAIHTLRDIEYSKEFKIYLPEAWRLFLSWWSPSTDASTTELKTPRDLDGLIFRRKNYNMDVEKCTYYADFTTMDLLRVAKQLYYRDIGEGMRKCYRLFAAWQLMRWQVEKGPAFKAIQYSDVILGILRGYLCEPLTVADRFKSGCFKPTETEVDAYEAYKRNHFAEYEARSLAEAQLQLIDSKVSTNATSVGVPRDDSEETASLYLERLDITNDALVSNSQPTRVLGTAMVPGCTSDMVETGRQVCINNENEDFPAAGNLQASIAESSPDGRSDRDETACLPLECLSSTCDLLVSCSRPRRATLAAPSFNSDMLETCSPMYTTNDEKSLPIAGSLQIGLQTELTSSVITKKAVSARGTCSTSTWDKNLQSTSADSDGPFFAWSYLSFKVCTLI